MNENRFNLEDDMGGDEGRLAARSAIIEAADNQIRGYPPTTEAYQRLLAQGISESDARGYIANLVARELFRVSSDQKPFNRERYGEWLARLPQLPED